MKLTYCLIFVIFFASHIEAQDINNVQLRIHYATTFKKWEDSKTKSSDE